jgi:hypothetical protein
VPALAIVYWISPYVPKTYTSPLSVWSPVVIIYTTYIDIYEISKLLAQCIHAFHVTVIKIYYFPKQLYLFFIMQAECVLRKVRN